MCFCIYNKHTALAQTHNNIITWDIKNKTNETHTQIHTTLENQRNKTRKLTLTNTGHNTTIIIQQTQKQHTPTPPNTPEHNTPTQTNTNEHNMNINITYYYTNKRNHSKHTTWNKTTQHETTLHETR